MGFSSPMSKSSRSKESRVTWLVTVWLILMLLKTEIYTYVHFCTEKKKSDPYKGLV